MALQRGDIVVLYPDTADVALHRAAARVVKIESGATTVLVELQHTINDTLKAGAWINMQLWEVLPVEL